MGVIPPPIKQYSPREINALSRCHTGQLSGSLTDSSGCGSSNISPSAVFFCWGGALDREEEREAGVVEGIEEVEWRSGWCLMPNGSLRLAARRRIVPAGQHQDIRQLHDHIDEFQYSHLPGTSSVCLSLRIPRVDFARYVGSSLFSGVPFEPPLKSRPQRAVAVF